MQGQDGITRPVDRVVVVGAGIAGLTVANALGQAGVDCVVLEATDRIGGRLHTIDLGGTPVDLGGSWIHHPTGNPLAEFAARAGIDCVPGDPLPTLGGFDLPEERRLSREEVARIVDLEDDFAAALDRLRVELPPGASAAQALASYVDTLDLGPHESRRARQELRAVIEADCADAAERQSLRWIWSEEDYGGDLFGDLPSPGYAAVVDALAGGLDVRTGAEVTTIDLNPGGVRVECADGTSADASHAVVCVPLGVLKQGRPTFSPSLPDSLAESVDRLGFGRYEKVILGFETAFWLEHGDSHLILFPPQESEPAMWVFDLAAFGAGPALACHVFHGATHHVVDRSPEDAVRWCRESLSRAWGLARPEPHGHLGDLVVDRPPHRGCLHAPPTRRLAPPTSTAFVEPVGGRLLFAGEHTHLARLGYADGAFSSGLRAAEQLLGGAALAR